MMQYSRPSVLFLICTLLLFGASSCITYEDVDFRGLKNVSVNHINQEGASIAITVRVHNPNNYKIKITRSDLDLFLNGRNVGKAQIDQKVVLKANSTSDYSFNVEASFKNMGNLLTTVMVGGPPVMKVEGWVKAKAFGVGKKFPVEFEEKLQMPSAGGLFGG